jgi:gallate decarboxylase subunit D
MEFTVATKNTDYNIEAFCKLLGNDLLVALWGGEKAHIGAVAVAYPRPSMKNPGGISASASVICLSGHQEDELARKMALSLASTLNKTVVVSAGIHWDNIPSEGILIVVQNCQTLSTMIIDRFPSGSDHKNL